MKKYIKYAAAGVALIGLVALAVVQINDYASYSQSLAHYSNAKLTDDKDEVVYRLGKPMYVMQYFKGMTEALIYGTADDADQKLPAGKKVTDFNTWLWDRPDSYLTVSFNQKGGLKEVRCAVSEPKRSGCPPLAGVGIGVAEEEVIKRLGKPTKVKISDGTKFMSYGDIGADFELEKGAVFGMSLNRVPSSGFKRFWRYSMKRALSVPPVEGEKIKVVPR